MGESETCPVHWLTTGICDSQGWGIQKSGTTLIPHMSGGGQASGLFSTPFLGTSEGMWIRSEGARLILIFQHRIVVFRKVV